MLNIFIYFQILAWFKKTEAIPILGPESAELFRSIPTREKKALNPRSLRLILVSIQRWVDRMRRGEGEKVWLKKTEGRQTSLMREFFMPILWDFLLAESFKSLFLHWRTKELEGMRKLVLDTNIPHLLYPGVCWRFGFYQNSSLHRIQSVSL